MKTQIPVSHPIVDQQGRLTQVWQKWLTSELDQSSSNSVMLAALSAPVMSGSVGKELTGIGGAVSGLTPTDDSIGIAEKPRWVAEWQAIQAEYPSISSEPLAVHSTYLAAYAALRDYLDTLPTWSDLSTATAITRTTWDGKWADYYAARSALFTRLERQALDDAADAGDAAATAQGTANNAATAAAAAQTAASNAAALAQSALASASTAQETADGKIRCFFQATAPTGMTAGDVGDLWFDSDDNNRAYRWSGTEWANAQDSRIASAIASAQTAQTTADGKAMVHFQTDPPTGKGAGDAGDLWVDTDDNNKLWAWSGTAWIVAQDWYAAVAAANNAATAAAAAQTAADEANAALADIAADGKLTPVEKQSTRLQWDTILGERAGIQSRADAVSVSRTTYDSAFQALATYLNAGTTWSSGTPSWLADANLSTTTPIDGPTFRANWKSLFDARQALLNAITAAAQAAANLAGMPPLPNFERDVAGVWPLTRLAASDSDVPEGCPTNFCGRLQSRNGACAQGFPVHPGMRIKLRAWVNTTKTVHEASFGLGFHATADGTDDNSHCNNWGFVPFLAAGSGWTLIEGILTVPAGAVTAYPWPLINAVDNYGSVYFTGLQISEAGAAADDAASAQAAANAASTAAAYADRLARSSNNLIKNANSEDPNPTGPEAIWVSEGWAYQGTKKRSSIGAVDWVWGAVTDFIPCAGGEAFVFEAMTACDPGGLRQIAFDFYDSTKNWFDGVYSGGRPSDGYISFGADSYRKQSVSGVAPTGTCWIRALIGAKGGGITSAFDCLYAARKVSAGMLEADILKAMLVKGEVIETPNYVPGSAGVPPVGARVAGAPWTITLLDGTTIQGNLEVGEGASIAGHPALSYANMLLYRKVEFASPGAWSWTVPAGVRRARITVCGAGGGGQGGSSSGGGLGGRNGATLVLELTNLTQGQVISGANGAAGAAGGAGSYGGAGGASTLTVAGKTWTINGGAGGGKSTTTVSTLTGGYGTTCTASERKTDLLDGSLLGGLSIQSLRYATGASGARNDAASAADGGYGSWLAPGGKGGDGGTAYAIEQDGANGSRGSGGGGGGGPAPGGFGGTGGYGGDGYTLIEY